VRIDTHGVNGLFCAVHGDEERAVRPVHDNLADLAADLDLVLHGYACPGRRLSARA